MRAKEIPGLRSLTGVCRLTPAVPVMQGKGGAAPAPPGRVAKLDVFVVERYGGWQEARHASAREPTLLLLLLLLHALRSCSAFRGDARCPSCVFAQSPSFSAIICRFLSVSSLFPLLPSLS